MPSLTAIAPVLRDWGVHGARRSASPPLSAGSAGSEAAGEVSWRTERYSGPLAKAGSTEKALRDSLKRRSPNNEPAMLAEFKVHKGATWVT